MIQKDTSIERVCDMLLRYLSFLTVKCVCFLFQGQGFMCQANIYVLLPGSVANPCRQSILAISNINYAFIFKFCVIITSVKSAANPGSMPSRGFFIDGWTCLKWQNIITVHIRLFKDVIVCNDYNGRSVLYRSSGRILFTFFMPF